MMYGIDSFKLLSSSIQQVVVTTYQTLNQDFYIPEEIDASEEIEWLADNGYV